MGRRRSSWVVAVVAGLLVRSAGAQDTAGLTRPVPRVVPSAPYPDGAVGEATVTLVLVIEKDGTVRSSEVIEGVEPFAAAAREATRAWTFAPARIRGEPAAAKISYVMRFKPPVPTPEPVEKDGPDPPPADLAAPPPREPATIDVTVEGERNPPPSVSSLTRAEVRELPGAFGDPFRAIEVLPGVTPIISGLPFFFVRGAPPGNIGYFLDGVRVPYLFHVAAGPSVVNPAFVERVDLYSGSYPTRFGRFTGAIVSAESPEPRSDWHGEAVLRLVDAGAFVEGGFDEGRGTVALGGRYSYTAALLSQLAPGITLDYRDFQARVTYDLTPRDRIGLFTFGSFDFLSSTEDDIETVIFGQEFYRADLRYDRKMPNGGFLRAAVTAGFDQTRLFASRNSQNFLYGSRMRVTQPVRDDLTVRAGVDMTVDNYQATAPRFADPDNPGLQRFDDLFPPRSDNAMALWADVVWKVNPRFEITPGLRYDQYISQGAFGASVDPRISAVTKVHPRIRLLQAVGLANQPPSFSVPLPGFAVASLRGGLQRSVQLSSGIEGKLPYEVTATVTGFTNAFFNLTDALGSQVDPTDPTLPRSLGSTKGLEIYIRRSLAKRFGGFVSYTLSRTTRSVGRERLVATFDRTHVLNSGVGYNLGGGWKTGLRFSVFSGTPTAPIPADSPPGTQLRDPAFYRLDFRAEKRWKIAETGFISFVAEMINITLNREVIAGEPLPPVTVPSLGLEGGF